MGAVLSSRSRPSFARAAEGKGAYCGSLGQEWLSSKRTEVLLGSGTLGVEASSAKGNKRGTRLGRTSTKDVPCVERLRGWRAGPWAAGARSSQHSRQQNLHRAADPGRTGRGTRQTSHGRHQPPFPGSAPHPQPSRPEGALLAPLHYLPGGSGAERAASWRKGVPGLGRRKGWHTESRGCLAAGAGEFRGVRTAAPAQNAADGLPAPHYPYPEALLGQPGPATPAGRC